MDFVREDQLYHRYIALATTIEKIKITNRKASIVFADISKAFNSMNRSAMLHNLYLYGLPGKINAGIKTMYENPETFVLSPDEATDFFFKTTGILRGDTLAPYLFIIVVDYILRISFDPINNHGLTLQKKSTSYPSNHITDLDYADCIALLSDKVNNAEILLQLLETAAHKVGLTLNSTKTEYMLLNGNVCYTLNSTSLNTVDDFRYIGSYIKDSKNDFNIRKSLVLSTCNKRHLTWKSSISKDIKIRQPP